jgi:hypothetical protein
MKDTENTKNQLPKKVWTAPKLIVLPVSFTGSGGTSKADGGAYSTMP